MSMKVCVVGIGYVGLPLAYLLCQYTTAEIHACDIDSDRIEAASRGLDHTGMVPTHTVDEFHDVIQWHTEMPRDMDAYLVCVPTPDNQGIPDYRYVDSATDAVLSVIGENGILVIESTVAPDTVRKRIVPKLGGNPRNVLVVHSPERINPGATAYHELHQSVKLVGVDDPDHESVGNLLLLYTRAFRGVEIVNDTRVAELAKCFENFQRDMNIAMMNELSMQCYKHGVDFAEVQKALRTKPSSPVFYSGMVGGHCIPVDPYYLATWYDPARAGYDLPSAGRVMNETFINFIFDLARKQHNAPRVLIVGATYKPDVADTRNSGAVKLHDHFEKEGIICDIYDPLIETVRLPPNRLYNVVIAAVNHSLFGGTCFATDLPLTIDCTAINVGCFPRRAFSGIHQIINL